VCTPRPPARVPTATPQVWRYEGANTLAFYLRRRDGIRALARDLDVPEELAVPVAMRHLLTGLAALHNAGLVHRDVKPLNIIFSERDKRLKLIDLGACAGGWPRAAGQLLCGQRLAFAFDLVKGLETLLGSRLPHASPLSGLRARRRPLPPDLRSGTNFTPDESILDPLYCPPEQV
jgi:serine/threonine protein kinase